MRAAFDFLQKTKGEGSHILVELYGSLALTGIGHHTDRGVLLGLSGYMPETVDPREEPTPELPVAIVFHNDKSFPQHPNGVRFSLYDENEKLLLQKVYFSIGGGFIVEQEKFGQEENGKKVPYPFSSGQDLSEINQKTGLSIAEIMLDNEKALRSDQEIKKGLREIWSVMKEGVDRGLRTHGILPGGLNVVRRAAHMAEELRSRPSDPFNEAMDWVSAWALAMNEENAAGGRVVTAPTNGASGVVPAVIHYYLTYTDHPNEEGIDEFLLAAAAICLLYKQVASISGAEMGCQGEVGVACSMAAGALAHVMGGTMHQVLSAAEIAMEHNIGMPCDPVMGLVQIPCIERNAMGAVEAINAARMALKSEGGEKVSLDQVIKTMKEVGQSMDAIYKETSLGGLAVNVVEC